MRRHAAAGMHARARHGSPPKSLREQEKNVSAPPLRHESRLPDAPALAIRFGPSFWHGWDRPLWMRRRLGYALAFSLFLHALFIALRLGLPGFGWPSLDRLSPKQTQDRAELHVALAPSAAPAPAALPPQRAVAASVPGAPALAPAASPPVAHANTPAPRRPAAAAGKRRPARPPVPPPLPRPLSHPTPAPPLLAQFPEVLSVSGPSPFHVPPMQQSAALASARPVLPTPMPPLVNVPAETRALDEMAALPALAVPAPLPNTLPQIAEAPSPAAELEPLAEVPHLEARVPVAVPDALPQIAAAPNAAPNPAPMQPVPELPAPVAVPVPQPLPQLAQASKLATRATAPMAPVPNLRAPAALPSPLPPLARTPATPLPQTPVAAPDLKAPVQPALPAPLTALATPARLEAPVTPAALEPVPDLKPAEPPLPGPIAPLKPPAAAPAAPVALAATPEIKAPAPLPDPLPRIATSTPLSNPALIHQESVPTLMALSENPATTNPQARAPAATATAAAPVASPSATTAGTQNARATQDQGTKTGAGTQTGSESSTASGPGNVAAASGGARPGGAASDLNSGTAQGGGGAPGWAGPSGPSGPWAARGPAAGNAIDQAFARLQQDRLASAPVAAAINPPLPLRRRTFLGRLEREVAVKVYEEAWRLKIERNGALNFPTDLTHRMHEDPVVTVAIRSDGSVEGVFFNRSSGMADLDAAVGRIVAMLSPFPAFPPELAREYDVLEIKDLWSFRDTLEIVPAAANP